MVNGTLPWILETRHDINAKLAAAIGKAQLYQVITQMKQQLPFAEMAKNLPVEFEDLIRYVRSLKFTDKPDYSYMRKMFDAVLYRAQYTDYSFDWKIQHKKEIVNL
jgi:hypothetical protein